MIIHVCSHHGDIELLPGDGDEDCRIRYLRLTPAERRILNEFLTQHEIKVPGRPNGVMLDDEGTVDVPMSMWEVGGILGTKMHGGRKLLSAVRFTDGTVQVQKGSVWGWFQQAGEWLRKTLSGPTLEDEWRDALKPDPPAPAPAAAVQTRMPPRGCPMPDPTAMRERKAAEVVAKFLDGQQREDFLRRRAFVAVGGDSGRLYRVTSRWSPEVSQFGVLFDLDRGRSICAYDELVPPSEEALAMKFAVENFEHEFLSQPHG